jgi:hypothetical protein
MNILEASTVSIKMNFRFDSQSTAVNNVIVLRRVPERNPLLWRRQLEGIAAADLLRSLGGYFGLP